MKHSFFASVVACFIALGMGSAQAKTPVKKPAATKKAPAKAKKAPVKKAAVQPKAAPVPVAQPAPTSVPGAEGEFPVLTGDFKCDEGMASIVPQGNEFALKIPGGRSYVMRRVPTTTGVVRLEGNGGKAYWLQSGNKSMLIDNNGGGRLADGCRNAIQQAREDQLKTNPSALLN